MIKNRKKARKQLFANLLMESENEELSFNKINEILKKQLEEVLEHDQGKHDKGNEEKKDDFDELLEFFQEIKAVEIQDNMMKMIKGNSIKDEKPDFTKKQKSFFARLFPQDDAHLRSIKSQQYAVLKRMQTNIKKILRIINIDEEIKHKGKPITPDQKIELQKNILKYLKVGIDIYGISIFRTGEFNKQANQKRNQIEKICTEFDKDIKELQSIHCHDSTQAKFSYPIKLHQDTQNSLFEYVTSRFKYQKEKNKEELIQFKMQELADVMINVDEENYLIVGSKKRVDSFYDFFEDKSQQLIDQFKKAIENIKAKNEYFPAKNDEDQGEEDEEQKTGAGMNMNDLEFVDLTKDNKNIKEFDGRFCVDCACEVIKNNPNDYKEKLEAYKQANQPYKFVFTCKRARLQEFEINDSEKDKEDDFYCGQCGIERVIQRQKKPKYLIVEHDIYNYSFMSMMKKTEETDDDNQTEIQSMSQLPEQSDLFFKSQMIFIIQAAIITILIKQNLIEKKDAFQKPYPTFIAMQLLASYLFHIETISGAKNSFQRLQFLERYPERFRFELRQPARIVCMQQFMINIVCEVMNLGLLCQQENFQDLILNYVAFAGILQIDNVYMETQKARYDTIADIIDNSDSTNHLELFKSRRFHHNYATETSGRVMILIARFIYKWFYFYVMPISVIPIGVLGWQSGNLNDYEMHDVKYAKVDHENKVNSLKTFQFNDNNYFQIYVFACITMFFLVIYAVFRIGKLDESIKKMKRSYVKITMILLISPFIMFVMYNQGMNFVDKVLPQLYRVGLYFKWVPIEYFQDEKHMIPLDDNRTDKFYLNFKKDLPHWLPIADLYLVISLIYNWTNSKDLDDLLDLFHFVVQTLIYPVIVFFLINDKFYAITLKPWNDLNDKKTKEDAIQTIIVQIYFTITFVTVKVWDWGLPRFENWWHSLDHTGIEKDFKGFQERYLELGLPSKESKTGGRFAKEAFYIVNFIRRYPTQLTPLIKRYMKSNDFLGKDQDDKKIYDKVAEKLKKHVITMDSSFNTVQYQSNIKEDFKYGIENIFQNSLKKSFNVKVKENEMTGSLFIAKIVLEHYFELYKREERKEGDYIDIYDLAQQTRIDEKTGKEVLIHEEHPILRLETKYMKVEVPSINISEIKASFVESSLSSGEYMIPLEKKEELPTWIFILVHFFVFVISFVIGLIAAILTLQVIVPLFKEMYSMLENILRAVIFDQIKYYRFGKWSSFYLYIEIYSVLTIMIYLFIYVFQNSLFEEEYLMAEKWDQSLSFESFDEKQDEGQSKSKKLKQCCLPKSKKSKQWWTQRAQIVFTMLITPFQLYFTFNFGFYYLAAILYSQPLFKEAIENDKLQIAISNPLIVFFTVVSVPYLFFGLIFQQIIQFDTLIWLVEDVKNSIKNFTFTSESMDFNPFALGNRKEWLPFVLFYLISLSYLVVKFYRAQKKKNTYQSYIVKEGKWTIHWDDESYKERQEKETEIEVKDGKFELDGKNIDIQVNKQQKKSQFELEEGGVRFCERTSDLEIIWKRQDNVNQEITWKKVAEVHDEAEEIDKARSEYFLTYNNKQYIPRKPVIEIAVALLTPFVTYLVMNWAMYFALSAAVRWCVFNNESESKPVSMFFMICFIMIALFSLWEGFLQEDETNGGDGGKSGDEGRGDEEGDEEGEDEQDEQDKEGGEDEKEEDKTEDDKNEQGKNEENESEEKKKKKDLQKQRDKIKEKRQNDKYVLFGILLIFSSMGAIACYPGMDPPLKYFSTMLLAFISALFFRSSMNSAKNSSADNFWMLISGITFVIIFTRPLTEGIKCYSKIINVPVVDKSTEKFYLLEYNGNTNNTPKEDGWFLECKQSLFFQDD